MATISEARARDVMMKIRNATTTASADNGLSASPYRDLEDDYYNARNRCRNGEVQLLKRTQEAVPKHCILKE